MGKKIKCVLVVPDFYGTENSIITSLEDNGFEVIPVIRVIGLKNPFLMLKGALGFDMQQDNDKYYSKMSSEIEEICFKEKPDVLLVVQGLQVLPDTLDRLRQHCVTVLSLSDRLSLFPQLYGRVSHYDIVFTYSKEEIENLRALGVSAYYSYMGYDDSVYHPVSTVKDIDICFVGTMYPERREILEKVALDFSQYNIAFYGRYATPFEPDEYLRWIRKSEFHRAFKNKKLKRDDVNKLYNRSKICLNINRKNMTNEWTPRIIEIMGTNSFQLVERNALIEKDFNDCVCMYDNYDNLKEYIKYYLDNDAERCAIAEKGYETASGNYTLKIRKKIKNDICKGIIYALQKEQPRSFDI